jgi:hypothetical protein
LRNIASKSKSFKASPVFGLACYHLWVSESTMASGEREAFYPATGKINRPQEKRIVAFCDAVTGAMANSGLSRCEALGCLAIIIAQEANADPCDPPEDKHPLIVNFESGAVEKKAG